MQTKIIQIYQVRDDGVEAEQILRSCVHCGFCNATCPSYQLQGNELDGPRGRIYLIKEMLEGKEVSDETRIHLDRCLTCRACETTCPSGVQYHRLVEIGRSLLAEKLPRRGFDKLTRKLLSELISRPVLFKGLLALGRASKPVLPTTLAKKIPSGNATQGQLEKSLLEERITVDVSNSHKRKPVARKALMLGGCVQDALSPNINIATQKVFKHFGIELVELGNVACCGSASMHLEETARAEALARNNIEAWWPLVSNDEFEFILVNASGCGLFVKEYDYLFASDRAMRDKAKKISEKVRDPIEVLCNEAWHDVREPFMNNAQTVAFHSPCTLQHGQQIVGEVEQLLINLGVKVESFVESGLCCGSAGTYSVLQPAVSNTLRERKLDNIEKTEAKLILTANIGCQTHLSEKSTMPVKHWLEFIAEYLSDS